MTGADSSMSWRMPETMRPARKHMARGITTSRRVWKPSFSPGDTDGGAQGNPGQAAQKGDQQDQTGISGQLHAQNQAQIGQQQKDAGKVDQHAGGHIRGNDSQLAYRGNAAAGSQGGKNWRYFRWPGCFPERYRKNRPWQSERRSIPGCCHRFCRPGEVVFVKEW